MTGVTNGWAVYHDGGLVFSADTDNWRTIGPAIEAIMGRAEGEPTGGLRKIKVRVTIGRKVRTLTYQTAQHVELNQEVQVPRWPGMPKGDPLRGTVVSLTSDREGPLVTIIGG